MASDTRLQSQVPESEVTTAAATVARSDPQNTLPRGGWWKRGLLAVGALAAIATAAQFMIGAVSPKASDSKLTYTITRGELLVTVTEQGTLESSNNEEIKCQVKGGSMILWIIEDGTEVKPGDELVRLDASSIEDNISQQKIAYQTSLATLAQSESDVAVAKISITEYLEGTFRSAMKTAQMNVATSESNLRTARNILNHTQRLFRKGYVGKLVLDGNEFSVKHAELELEVMQTELDALERFTKAKTLEELRSTLKAAEAKLASDKAALKLEKARLDRAEKQLDNCTLRAETSGMVIYPAGEKWENAPPIEEGSTVREQQTLLHIPDLGNMQIKVGIHEAKLDKVKPGMPARVKIQDDNLDGEVLSIASVTGPVGWWNGNVVKYDTIIKLNTAQGLKPGMSAEVEVFLARHEDVLTIPVAAVVQDAQGFHCWVQTADSTRRRSIDLGDSNDEFMVVKAGLKQGDRVVLNPRAFIEEAQAEALKPRIKTKPHRPSAKPLDGPKPPGTEPQKPKEQPAKTLTGAAIIKFADKNGDGVLTEEEFAEKDRSRFDEMDSNEDGKVDAGELDASLKRVKDTKP